MIPRRWRPVQRPADDELVGYLAPGGTDGLAVPMSLSGEPLGPEQPADSAVRLLAAAGLAALDGRWWCRLPGTLPGGVLAAGEPGSDWSWRPVVLVEVSPAGCRVRPEMPAPEELTAQAGLPVPVGGLLRRSPPTEAAP